MNWYYYLEAVPGKNEYYITHKQCGICKLTKQEHCEEITKHLCMMDYYTFELQNAVLDRTKTLGYGDDECNFHLMSKERAVEINLFSAEPMRTSLSVTGNKSRPIIFCEVIGRLGYSSISTALIRFAGTPPTIVFAATSFVTTAPAAIIAPSPTVTPGRMVTLAPIQTFLPMATGLGIRLARFCGF